MDNQTHIYSDLNQSLTSEYVYNVDAIKQSLNNILTTRKGTKIFNADFGSNLDKYLFEIMDETTAFGILNEVIIAVNKWEPRVYVVSSQSGVTCDYTNGIYWVNLVFKIKDHLESTELHNFEIGIVR